MTVEFKLTENDFLIHQLYLASISERIRKKRQRNRIQFPLFFTIIALLLLAKSIFLGIVLFIFALSWFLFYPISERKHYIEHYQSFIKENYQERTEKLAFVEFNNDFIFSKDETSEAKVSTKEIEEIVELPTIIFVKLKGGQSLILPKENIKNIEALIVRLKELANYLKIDYTVNDKWEWK